MSCRLLKMSAKKVTTKLNKENDKFCSPCLSYDHSRQNNCLAVKSNTPILTDTAKIYDSPNLPKKSSRI